MTNFYLGRKSKKNVSDLKNTLKIRVKVKFDFQNVQEVSYSNTDENFS